ncbi:alpha/beta fold hydrolase [Herbiconiux sp.]|uniref:alpha/beta fold hydrolase n=1 Tax=Herbiconiux sp. TaxID=1871186 RepID=UPI0025BFE15E|nr:alpha/beta fold hydrolase [Herbiconiux sp.]
MTTVLMLHGLGNDRANPLALFSPIVPPGSLVIAPDVRAHGDDDRIGPPSAFALPALASDVAARVRAEQAAAGREGEPFTVIGISMGAAIALRLLLSGELPLERAVFVRPAFTEVSLPENLRAFPVIGELLAARGARQGEEEFRRTSFYAQAAASSTRGAAGLLEQFRSPGAAARAVRLVEIPRNPAFTAADDLAALGAAVPTAVAWAPRDPVHPVAVAESWMARLGAPGIPLPARDENYSAYVAATRSGVAGWLGWS